MVYTVPLPPNAGNRAGRRAPDRARVGGEVRRSASDPPHPRRRRASVGH